MSREHKIIAELFTSYFVSRVAFRCVHAGETTLIEQFCASRSPQSERLHRRCVSAETGGAGALGWAIPWATPPT